MIGVCNNIGSVDGYDSCEDYCTAESEFDAPLRNLLCYNAYQYDWLRAELKTAEENYEHIFVFAHAVFLAGGSGHGPFNGAEKIRELLEKHNVKIAFNGHNHAYHRTFPVKNEIPDPQGTTYLTVGSSGGLFDYATVNPTWTAKTHQDWANSVSDREAMSTYTRIDVVDDQIKVSTYNIKSAPVPVDEFEITSANGGPMPIDSTEGI